MAPITVNARVEEVMRARKTPVGSWYFDFTPIMTMWGSERTYHHTPPISLIYAMREALRLVLEEGLEARWERHLQNQQALIAGLEAMGLELFVANPADRLVTVTGVKFRRAWTIAKCGSNCWTNSTSKSPAGSGRQREKSGAWV